MRRAVRSIVIATMGRVLAMVLLLGACYPGALKKGAPARLSQIDAGGCHVAVLDEPPAQRPWRDVGRVHVYADQARVDENWAIEALAAQACGLGANAIVLIPDGEAPPAARWSVHSGTEWVSFQARALRLTDH